MKDLSTISSDLFNKIRSRFTDVKIGNAAGELTTEESEARFFDINYNVSGKDLGRINIKIDEKALTVIYNESMLDEVTDKSKWYDFLKELRQFARSNLLNFDTRDITKSNLDKRDYQYLAKDTGDLNMKESRLFGTSKTSFQDVGEAKLIVKHSAPVNMENPAGRTQRIESIYIESADGERFRYPHRHLNGARAMARHVANGGTAYDTIGQYISGLSEEIGKLRQFKNYTQRAGVMAEALGDITEQVAERIDSIKLEIAALQKQQYYDAFKENFQPRETEEVPEDLMNDWVDALTIKSFNEELKSVFPYIYSLVKEKTEQGLNYDDLVQEATCPECHSDPCECEEEKTESNDMFSEFENTVDELATPEFEQQMAEEPNEGNEFAKKVQQLKAKGAKPGTKFTTSDGKEHTLEDAINAAGMAVTDFWTEEELAEMQPQKQAVPQEVVEFIASMYDKDTGTFPKGEEGVKIAVEKKFGEQAGKFANYVVEKLSAKSQTQGGNIMQDSSELSRMRELAGIHSAQPVTQEAASGHIWDEVGDDQDKAQLKSLAGRVVKMYQRSGEADASEDEILATLDEIVRKYMPEVGKMNNVAHISQEFFNKFPLKKSEPEFDDDGEEMPDEEGESIRDDFHRNIWNMVKIAHDAEKGDTSMYGYKVHPRKEDSVTQEAGIDPNQHPQTKDYGPGHETPEDLLAAVEEEYNQPGRHIDNLQDVMNATFDADDSPEFEKARAIINRYLEFVTNTDVDHYDDDEDPDHEDEPMIRRMRHGNIQKHIREYDLGDYLASALHELKKVVNSTESVEIDRIQRLAGL